MREENNAGRSFTFPGTLPTVNRMGYGAMQLAGRDGDKLVWGPPRDIPGAIALLREAVASGVKHLGPGAATGALAMQQIWPVVQQVPPQQDSPVAGDAKTGFKRTHQGQVQFAQDDCIDSHKVPILGKIRSALQGLMQDNARTAQSSSAWVGNPSSKTPFPSAFLEKPITQTVAEADALCGAASGRGLIIQVGHIERFNPAILALEKYKIEPMFVESHRLAQFNPRGTDVGVVLDLMIHDIDLILAFVHSPVRAVEANGVAVVSDTADIANARIQFENGCVANVTASRISQRKMRKMRLFQKSGYISIDFSEGTAEVFRLVGEDEPDTKGTMMLGELGSGKHRRKIVYELPEVKEVNALRYELELFARAAVSGTRPVVSGEDGRRALVVANAIMEKISQQSFSM